MKYPQQLYAKLEWTRLRRAFWPGNLFDEHGTLMPGNGGRPARTIAPSVPLAPLDRHLGFV